MRDAAAAARGRDGRTTRGKAALSAAARGARARGRTSFDRARGRGADSVGSYDITATSVSETALFAAAHLNRYPADSVRAVQKFVLRDQLMERGLAGSVEGFIAGAPIQFPWPSWAALHFLPSPIVVCMMIVVFGGRDGLFPFNLYHRPHHGATPPEIKGFSLPP
jgi:hypothetical protein